MEYYTNLISTCVKYFIDYVKKVPGFDLNPHYKNYDKDSSNV